MNPMLYTFLAIAVLASPAIAIFDGGLTAVLGTAGLSLAAGTGGALFITNAGLVAGAVGLLGAAIVKGSLAGRGFRGKREAKEGEEDTQTLLALQLVDSYFMTILDMDIDDCGECSTS